MPRIYATDKPSGAHWDSVPPPDKLLENHLEEMTCALSLLRGEGAPGEENVLNFDPGSDEDIYVFIGENFALDFYETCHKRGGDIHTVAYTLITGVGGPHIEMTDADDVLSLAIYWGGKWEARSVEADDLEVFRSFCEAFYKYS